MRVTRSSGVMALTRSRSDARSASATDFIGPSIVLPDGGQGMMPGMSASRRQFLGSLASIGAAAAVAPMAVRFGSASAAAPLRVDASRLRSELEALSVFGRPPGGTFADGVSRTAYSDADVAARRYVMDLMRGAGLTPRIDPACNIFAARAGAPAGARPILIGSHIDSVPGGGNFDGALGSLAAIEAARAIGASGLTTRHPVEVVVWAHEEGGDVSEWPEWFARRRRPADRRRDGPGVERTSSRRRGPADWRRPGPDWRGPSRAVVPRLSRAAHRAGRDAGPPARAGRRRRRHRRDLPVPGHDRRRRQPRRHHADGRSPGRADRRLRTGPRRSRGSDAPPGPAGRHGRPPRRDAERGERHSRPRRSRHRAARSVGRHAEGAGGRHRAACARRSPRARRRRSRSNRSAVTPGRWPPHQ